MSTIDDYNSSDPDQLPVKKYGKNKFKIDYERVELLCKFQCTQEEIAADLGCCSRTLQRDEEFCRIYQKAKKLGQSSLRAWQIESAKNGNIAMQIWLGKQYLGQKEKNEEALTIYTPPEPDSYYDDDEDDEEDKETEAPEVS